MIINFFFFINRVYNNGLTFSLMLLLFEEDRSIKICLINNANDMYPESLHLNLNIKNTVHNCTIAPPADTLTCHNHLQFSLIYTLVIILLLGLRKHFFDPLTNVRLRY